MALPITALYHCSWRAILVLLRAVCSRGVSFGFCTGHVLVHGVLGLFPWHCVQGCGTRVATFCCSMGRPRSSNWYNCVVPDRRVIREPSRKLRGRTLSVAERSSVARTEGGDVPFWPRAGAPALSRLVFERPGLARTRFVFPADTVVFWEKPSLIGLGIAASAGSVSVGGDGGSCCILCLLELRVVLIIDC